MRVRRAQSGPFLSEARQHPATFTPVLCSDEKREPIDRQPWLGRANTTRKEQSSEPRFVGSGAGPPFVEHACQQARRALRKIQLPAGAVNLPLANHHGPVIGKDVILESALLGLGLAAEKLPPIRPDEGEEQVQSGGLAPSVPQPERRIRCSSAGITEIEDEVFEASLPVTDRHESKLRQARHQPTSAEAGVARAWRISCRRSYSAVAASSLTSTWYRQVG